MTRVSRCIVAVFATLIASTAIAAEERRGTLPNGAAWVIAIPDRWRAGDDLVLVQHGFRFVPVTTPDLGPSAQAMLADGVAIAATGYHQRGWAIGDAVDDNVQLLDLFRSSVGEPGHVVTHGGSMGGLVALKLAEDARVRDRIAGVVALCPAVDGVGTWDRAFDMRIAYDALCADVPGGPLPVGDAPLPWASNADVLAQAPVDATGFPAAIRALPAVQACLALHLPRAQRDAAANARLDALQAIAGTDDEEQFAAMMNYAVFGLTDLLRDPAKLDGANPFFNRARVVDGAQNDLQYRRDAASPLPATFDADVLRVTRDDAARLAFHRATSTDGSASARIVSIHTSGDGIVAARDQRFLVDRFEFAPTLVGVTKESTPTHCGFSQGEYDAAWKTMHAWLAPGASTPSLADLQAQCLARNAGACRFDAEATALALSDPPPRLRAPLVDVLSPVIHTLGGLWWDPARPSQGVMIEELDDPVSGWTHGEQRVAVSWYSWAPAADPEPGPRWFYGVGRVYERGVAIKSMLELRKGRFGAALDPAVVERVHWGTVELRFGGPQAQLEYDALPAYGQGTVPLTQLTRAGVGLDARVVFVPPMRYDAVRTGTYFDPQHAVGGWMLDQYPSDAGVPVAGSDAFARWQMSSLLVWFTWDPNGRPLWMFGIDDNAFDGIAMPMQRAVSGGRFEPGYAASDVRLLPWGAVTLTGCEHGSVQRVAWQAATHGYGDGDVAVERLTWPNLPNAISSCP